MLLRPERSPDTLINSCSLRSSTTLCATAACGRFRGVQQRSQAASGRTRSQGALPIVLARFSPRGQSNPASELIRAHAYWRRCGRIADLVLLHDAAPADELHDQLERLGVLRQNLSTGDGAVSPRSMRLTQSRAPPDRVSVLAHGTVERVWTTPLGGSFSTRAPCLSTNSGCEVSPGQAARRSYRWWSPPTSGRATMRPAPTASTPRASGVSLPSAR